MGHSPPTKFRAEYGARDDALQASTAQSHNRQQPGVEATVTGQQSVRDLLEEPWDLLADPSASVFGMPGRPSRRDSLPLSVRYSLATAPCYLEPACRRGQEGA